MAKRPSPPTKRKPIPAPAAVRIETVPLSSIDLGVGIQPRAETNSYVASEYADAMREGATFPPVVIFKEGDLLRLVDGWHRYNAARAAGLTEIAAEIHDGDLEAATLFAVGANALHGERRTNADKRHAVTMALKQWPEDADSEIARKCGVSHPFVGNVRAILKPLQDSDRETRTVTRGGTTYQQKVPRKKTEARGEPPEAPSAPVATPPSPPPPLPVPAEEPRGNKEDHVDQALGNMRSFGFTPSAKLIAKIEQLRVAEAKAAEYRKTLPTKEEALEISKKTGGWVRANNGKDYIFVTPEDRRRTKVWLGFIGNVRSLNEREYEPKEIVASLDNHNAKTLLSELADAMNYIDLVWTEWDKVYGTKIVPKFETPLFRDPSAPRTQAEIDAAKERQALLGNAPDDGEPTSRARILFHAINLITGVRLRNSDYGPCFKSGRYPPEILQSAKVARDTLNVFIEEFEAHERGRK